MHSRRRRQGSRRTQPVHRNIEFFRIDGLRLIGAGKVSNDFSRRGIDNFQRNGTGRRGFQPIVEHRAIGRILSSRFFGRERRVGVIVAAHTIG